MAELHQYALDLDGPLFRKQRLALLDCLAATPPGELREVLEGLNILLDDIADQAHDRYGIDCLFDSQDEADDPRCECERFGYFYCGVPGILAHLENGKLAAGAAVERCGLCLRYPSDEAAREKLKELGYAEP